MKKTTYGPGENICQRWDQYLLTISKIYKLLIKLNIKKKKKTKNQQPYQ